MCCPPPRSDMLAALVLPGDQTECCPEASLVCTWPCELRAQVLELAEPVEDEQGYMKSTEHVDNKQAAGAQVLELAEPGRMSRAS